MSGQVNLVTANVSAMLCDSGYVPDYTGHQYVSDITHEVVGSGYQRQVLTGKRLVKGLGRTVFNSDPITFAAVTDVMVARWMILFVDTGDPTTSPLLCAVLMDASPADITTPPNKFLIATPDGVNGWLYV